MGRPIINKQSKRIQDGPPPAPAIWFEHEAALNAAVAAGRLPLPVGPFDLIYGDPGYRFEPYSRVTGMSRSADRHYATSRVEDLCSIPVKKIAAADCILLLWATVPMMPQALTIMEAWGFTYKSGLVWVKNQIGTGYWNRNQHELLLIGTCGHPRAPLPGLRRSSVIQAARRRHSQKPDEAYEWIEHCFPHLSKAELFARNTREGWAGWGLEYGAGPASREPAPKLTPTPKTPTPKTQPPEKRTD
jgi:N6-adenosine-specific RNA methylase IME4